MLDGLKQNSTLTSLNFGTGLRHESTQPTEAHVAEVLRCNRTLMHFWPIPREDGELCELLKRNKKVNLSPLSLVFNASRALADSC